MKSEDYMEGEHMTLGEYFRLRGMDFPMETFRLWVRRLKIPHVPGSRPYRYAKEDLDRAYAEMARRSHYLRVTR